MKSEPHGNTGKSDPWNPQPGLGRHLDECVLFLILLKLSSGRHSANQSIFFFIDTNGPDYQGPVHMNHTTLKEIFFKIIFIFFLFLSS